MKPNLLKAERELRGWSQSKIAELLGTTTRTVGRWERGEAVPHPHYREQLCTLLGKNAHQLGWLEDLEEETLDTRDLEKMTTESLHGTLTEPWLLLDPAISQVSEKANSLLGRHDLLTQVKACLFATDNLTSTALEGLPGSGKTTLAVAVATDWQVQAHFCDGILWAALGPHPNVLGQLVRWGKLLGVTSSEVENAMSLQAWNQALRAAIGTRCFLLVIDDAWAAEDALALQVGGTACAHLLTTHLPHVAHAFAPQGSIIVPPLQQADGLALLARFVPQLVQQDPEGAQALVEAVDSLPLALTLMGHDLASQTLTSQPQSLQATLTQLHEIEERLAASTSSRSGELSLRFAETMPLCLHATIAICDQHLSPQAHAALCALSIFASKPESFPKQAALTVSQQSVETFDELLEAGLLESWGPERYTLHQTIADYARAQDEALRAHQLLNSSLVGDTQAHERKMHLSANYLSWRQSLQDGGLRHMSSAWTLLPLKRFPLGLQVIVSIIFLAGLMITSDLLVPNMLPFFRSAEVTKSSMKGPASTIIPSGTSYEAEAPENTLTDHAQVHKCYYCSGGKKVSDIIPGSTLQFNNIRETSADSYTLTICYINGTADRTLYMTVNDKPAIAFYAPSMKSWNVVGTLTTTIYLNAGSNTIKFFNPWSHAPDIDRILIQGLGPPSNVLI